MTTTILYIILIVVILFGAVPFSLIESILNSLITSVNVIMALLAAVVNGFIVLLLGVVYGIVNLVVGTVWGLIQPLVWGMGDYVPLDVQQLALWSFEITAVDFSMWFDTQLSPIGLFLNTLFNDPFLANLVGGIALGTLAILLVIIAMKTRK